MHSKNKKPTKKLLVLKWTKFHVKLRNFKCYGLILVSYKKTCSRVFVKKFEVIVVLMEIPENQEIPLFSIEGVFKESSQGEKFWYLTKAYFDNLMMNIGTVD